MVPKNILMMGPADCGKTREIAAALESERALLSGRSDQFTEVGFMAGRIKLIHLVEA